MSTALAAEALLCLSLVQPSRLTGIWFNPRLQNPREFARSILREPHGAIPFRVRFVRSIPMLLRALYLHVGTVLPRSAAYKSLHK